MILAKDSNYLNSVYEFKENLKKNSTYPWRIVSIIYNNETMVIANLSNIDQETPLFAVDDEMYKNLEQFDISNRNDNFWISLFCK